jgi:hypothetical protein
MPREVLIISRLEDSVSRRVEAALMTRGHRVTWFHGPGAAQRFTIRVTARGDQVEPDLPMFVRPVYWWDGSKDLTPDERFLRSESFATIWAATALCDRPVINRPTPEGPVYRLTTGALKTHLAGRGEIHASGPEQITEDDGTFWGENAEFRVGALSTLPPRVPVRARRVLLEAGYEIVTVVGAQAFPATTDPRSKMHNLAARSIDITHQFGVQFATITWAVTDDVAEAVRLNPTPSEGDLRYRWADVLNALCRALLA